MAMKQFKLKKLIAALQAGTMTTLVCISLPVYASDIELYKAPRSSETTIMFMLDVSGSMNPDSNTYRENRIQSLKNGMTKLLQGDIESGVEPLPDKLVVGLSEFGGASGRVKLEARALGEKTDLPGSRPLFQTQQTFTQSVQRSVDQKRTWSATPQTRKQNGTRKYECFLFIICDWGSVSNWGPTNGGWLPTVINNSIGGSWVDQPKGNWTLIGSPQETSEVSNPQECITWNDSGSSCTKWETTLKTEDDFGEVIKQDESSQLNLSSNIIDSGYSLQKDSAPSYGEVQNGKETCNKENCERIQTRNAQITSTRTYTQTTTGSYTVTTTYYGTAKETHRKKMIRAVSALSATDSTPTGYAYAEVAAYLMGQTTKDQTGSGFSSSSSNTAIQDGSFYTAPNSINSTKQCNTQGIYFLTDGNPQYYYNKKQADLESFMKKSLGTAHGTNFSCSNDSTLGKLGSGYNNNNTMASPNGWNCIGAYTKALLDPTLNPAGVSIKTAVVGLLYYLMNY
jgi:type IV pilus assembly protein PilY1